MPPSGRSSLAAAMGVVDGIHSDAADLWPFSEPAVTASLSEADVDVVFVSDLSDGSAAVQGNAPHFAGGQAECSEFAFLGEQLTSEPRGARQLAALSGREFDERRSRPLNHT